MSCHGCSTFTAAPQFEPLLIRAHARGGMLYEVVARLELGGTGLRRSVVLRLDTHIMISNLTGGSASGATRLYAHSFPGTQKHACSALSTVPPAYPFASQPANVRPSGYMLHLVQPEPILRATMAAPSSASSSGTAAWVEPSQQQRSGGAFGRSSGGPPQTLSAVGGGNLAGASTVLRPGAMGVPVHWLPGALSRLLALVLPQVCGRPPQGVGYRRPLPAGAAGTSTGLLVWQASRLPAAAAGSRACAQHVS